MRHHVTTKASCLLLLAALVNADFFYPTHDELLYSSHRGAFGRRLNLRQSGRNGFECPGEGFFADPKDCSKFYRCVNYGNGNGYAAFEFKCSEGTVFDESIIACNHPWAVNGPCGATQVSSGEMGSEQPHGPATGGRPPPTPAPEPEPEPEPTDNEIEGASTGSGSDSRPNCKEEGYFTDENDCRKFYRCVSVDTEGHFDVYRFACGPGTVFDETKRVCAHPRDVEGRCGVTEAANEVDSEDMGQSGSMESTTAGGSSSESSPSNSESSTSSSSNSESSSSSSHSESSTSSSSNNESPNSSESTTSSSQSSTSSSSSSESSTSSSSQSSTENNPSSSGSNSSSESKPSGESEDSQSQNGNDCNKPAYKGECEEEGFFPVAGDCTKFYRCVSNGKPGSFSKYDFECGEGTVFDPDNNVCNHASAVQRDCDNPESASQTMGSENNGTQNESSKPAEPEGSNEVNPEDSESPSSESSSESTTAAGSSESSTSSSAESSSESSSENSSPAESSSESSSQTPETSESSSESSGGSNENTSESSSTEAGSSEAPSESSSESGSSESTTPTSEDSSSEGTGKDQCSSEGFHPTTGDCKKFHRCVDNGKGGFDKYDFVCGDGTVFDPKHNVCNHERDVDRDCGAPTSGEDNGGEEGSTPAGEEDGSSEGSENEGASSPDSGSQSSTENGSSESSTEGSQTGVSPAEGEENSAGAPEEQNSTEGSSQGQSSTEGSSPGSSEGDSTTTQSSQSSSDSGECTSEGFFPHKSDCKKFYRCVDNGKGGLTKYDFDCAEGTVFDPEINVCNHERDVQRDCSASMTTTPASENQETTTQAGTTQISDGEMATTTQLTIDNEPPGVESTTTTTEDPNPDEPTPPISPPCIHIDPNPPVVNCTMDGYYPDPTNCSNFYRCIGFDDENQKFNVYFFRCPDGKYYDPQRNVCDKPEKIQPPRDCEAMEETTTSAATTTQSSGEETTTTSAETTTAAETTPSEDSTTTAATDTTAAQTETTTQAASETTTQPPDEQQQTTTASPDTESTTPSEEQQTTTEAAETTTAAPESTKEPGGEETTTAMPEDSTTPASEETTPFEPSDNTTTTEPPPESSCDCCNLEEGQYAYVCPTGFRRHPKYCNRFYQCTQKEENDVNVLVLNCPEGLLFDTAMQKCVDPEEAAPCNGEIAPEASPAGRSRNSKIAVRVGREDLCPNTGFYQYEDDCQHFIHCQSDAQGNIRGKMKRCPEGFTFWEVSRRCEVVARIAKRCSGRSKSVMAWNIPTDYSNIGRLSRQLLRML